MNIYIRESNDGWHKYFREPSSWYCIHQLDSTPIFAFMILKEDYLRIASTSDKRLVTCQTSSLNAWNIAQVDRWPFQIDFNFSLLQTLILILNYKEKKKNAENQNTA